MRVCGGRRGRGGSRFSNARSSKNESGRASSSTSAFVILRFVASRQAPLDDCFCKAYPPIFVASPHLRVMLRSPAAQFMRPLRDTLQSNVQRCCRCAPQRFRSRTLLCRSSASVLARWRLDARFGCKQQVLAALQTWINSVASVAGLDSSSARVASVQLGGRESCCELELSFASLSELEAFWLALPVDAHAAWSRSLAPLVVDASPSWTVLRLAAIDAVNTQPIETLAASTPALRRRRSGLFVPESSEEAASVELDWKGEPLIRRPGDKMPRII